MSRYYIKPVFWNTNNYTKPSGAKATSGYPHEFGYGHEEWNNSARFDFKEPSQLMHGFHTQPLGNVPVADFAGQIFVFMIASHDGIQQLVGVAGKATWLDNKSERTTLVRKLKLAQFREDAWSVARVRECFNNDQVAFRKHWDKELQGLPNWKASQNFFFWPHVPPTLEARRITGKRRLPNMFGVFKEISPNIARIVMEFVPEVARTKTWSNITAAIEASADDLDSDIEEINRENRRETTRKALVDARRGQGKFRSDLIDSWGGACAVSRCSISHILRASHIKPWEASSHKERLDSANGILLSANIDALFDHGLVSFEDDGQMMVSRQISDTECKRLGLPASLGRRIRESKSIWDTIVVSSFARRF